MWSTLLQDPAAKSLRRGLLIFGLGGLLLLFLSGVLSSGTTGADLRPESAIADTGSPRVNAPTSAISTPRLMVSFLVVLVLLVGGAWLVRRLLRGARFTPRGDKILQVLDVLPLGARRQIVVVKAYGRRLVLGASADRLTLLSEFNDEEVHTAATTLDFEAELQDRLSPPGINLKVKEIHR